MASDLKIEIFAYDIISSVFMTLGEVRPSIPQIYGDECEKINSYIEACDKMFYEAVISRFILFKRIYFKDLTDEIIKSLKSLSDCYDYVIQICDRNDLFGHLTVFERMFATLAFVITLCVRIYYDTTCSIDVLNYGYLFWTMYSDKLMETFYNEGGWNKLKKVAKSYFKITSFTDVFSESEDHLHAMKETFYNYHQFKKTTQFCKYKHVSKQWTKFRIKSFESYIIIPLFYKYSIDAYEADLLLEYLKRLCDPNSENCIETFEKCMTYDYFEEIKSNDNLAIEHNVSERKSRTIDVYCGELSKTSTGFENLTLSELPFSNIEVFPSNLIGNEINLKSHDKTCGENDLRKANSVSFAAHSRNNDISIKTMNGQFGTKIGNIPEDINLYLDHSSENISLNIKNDVFPTKNFSKSIERQNYITKQIVPYGTREHVDHCSVNMSLKNDVFPKKKNSPKSIEWQNNASGVGLFRTNENALPKNVHPLICFSPVNEFDNITNKRLGISKDIDDIDIKTKTSSVDQMAVCGGSETAPLIKHVPSPKDLKPVNKCVNTTYEKTKAQKYADNLKYQNDGLGGFQRMLLVLGDRQGIEYVRLTLQNSDGQNLQENSTKRKKRCKKRKKASGI